MTGVHRKHFRTMKNRLFCLLCTMLLIFSVTGCGEESQPVAQNTVESETTIVEEATSSQTEETSSEEPVQEEEKVEPTAKTGDIMILFTSDVHCGIDSGFGYAGLQQIRENLEAEGYTTILVDDGDSIQGEPIGTLSKGETIISLMNLLQYDVAIPGNHEFDYGMERFLELTKMADFPYISCNFNKEGELVFDPYVIIEAAGKKIAFVGVTTPRTLNTSTPAYFQDGNGNYIYGFLQDETGEGVYEAVQNAVDAARAEGADFVYVMAHLGDEAECIPWTYADVISHTNGIDVLLDGHRHDTEQVVMKNKDGEDVIRSACGTKLNCIGYSLITADGEIEDTGVWSWPNKKNAAELFGIQNPINEAIQESKTEYQAKLGKVVANSSVVLTIYDPEAVDNSGNPIRMIRRAETNLGDLCADAILAASGADVAIMNGGGIRKNIEKGEVTYGNIINVFPFGNQLCVMEVTGQQILDALEWGARSIPDENGGFLQVAGMSYEIDASVASGCIADDNQMWIGHKGAYRVKNVMVGDEPLDVKKKYTFAGVNYTLLEYGDGFAMFEGAELLQDRIKLDNQLLIDYIVDDLGGEIGEGYTDPFGQGRITITE